MHKHTPLPPSLPKPKLKRTNKLFSPHAHTHSRTQNQPSKSSAHMRVGGLLVLVSLGGTSHPLSPCSSSVCAYFSRRSFSFLHVRRVLFCFGLYPSPVFGFVVHVESVGFALGRAAGVGVVKEVLDADQDLLKGNGGSPSLLFVENRQTDRPGRVHVGMKEGRNKLTLGRFRRILLRKLHRHPVDTPVPIRTVLPRNTRLPHHYIRTTITLTLRTSVEANRMITTPSLAFLLQTTRCDSRTHTLSVLLCACAAFSRSFFIFSQ